MKNSRGFTLIEIIISIAILSIITISILPIFAGGMKNIVVGGDRTERVLEKQSDINKEIKGSKSSAKEVTVTFQGLDPVKVEGEFIFKSIDDNDDLRTFVPYDDK